MLMAVNNHELNVEGRQAKGKDVVVFLHHGLGSTAAWRKQVPALVEAGFRTIVYDRWGYGKSEKREGIDMPGFEQDQADLESLLNQLGIEKATLVGHSDGGTIALYFASAHPERMSCLVTVAAHVYVEKKMKPGIEAVQQVFENDWRFREGLRRSHGEKYEQVFHNWFDGWHRPECLDWDMRSRLVAVSCPTLVTQGAEDEHATAQHAQDIAVGIQGAELWLAEGAGHMLPQDEPDLFNLRLLQFLRQHGLGSNG